MLATARDENRFELADRNLVADEMHAELLAYIERGHRPGEALYRKLSCLPSEGHGIKAFMICWAPPSCWGSTDAVERWIAAGGLYGRPS